MTYRSLLKCQECFIVLFNYRKKITGSINTELDKVYMDRFNLISWQCSILSFIIATVLITSILCVTKLYVTTSYKVLKPFVIQIDEHTGVSRIVNPVSKEKYSENIKLRDFYITNYITARESYTPPTYQYAYYTLVKALSAPFISSNFNNLMRITQDEKKFPGYAIHINSIMEISVKVESIRSLPKEQHNINGQAVQVYFKQYSPNNPYFTPRHKMATIGYDFHNSNLGDELYKINPLQFRVIYYNLTDVSSANF